LKILPAAFVVVGATDADARAKMNALDALVHPDSGLASLSVALGHVDLTNVDLDGPLPEIPETNASKGSRQKIIDVARDRQLSVRQLCQYVAGSYGSLELIGTASSIADQMQEWLTSEACDGFNVLFPHLPGGLDDFVDQVVPELQRRGLFRREYAGSTLRENLGLRRPRNQFFER
jgi:alkanesulfonate monooxygenase SsuD/methylene tetrahydromethanopterin reductase-like flavin-dependent oxidoreductase (luciferase family)